jgi:YHS domain-containing protein
MDTEPFKPLLSILIWGGLFFLMMRFGCGAHVMGGHGHHGGHGDAADAPDLKDPVCGMTVDRQTSTAASTYRGKTYYFCSASCRDKFEASPEKYVSAQAQPAHQSGGHHHG